MSWRVRLREGFNPAAVAWHAPDEPVPDTCSYCDADLSQDGFPILIWNQQGWCARFCSECRQRWWVLEKIGDGG